MTPADHFVWNAPYVSYFLFTEILNLSTFYVIEYSRHFGPIYKIDAELIHIHVYLPCVAKMITMSNSRLSMLISS